ncbi:adenosylmethionine--8-amino-7-oxononanoate transaminase [Cellvibrio japonicus]|nr:adenosylmethionine--8-amino-7-oxononanoate transaminase [Cellvibrio japonicus]QEI12539.1 adenosylmethionine--8-amino-7-oxononanoate transaminase [Cellvibrio japonicus]QEI16113.1 adenosylmethionine--8-amino-7-oxononanoate transaminase [Cellvibrio japonicus]QEI19691.1 adenosylmethionine--8-amino-7-oxononanoate transaminase [Cellvibrio japonicus]
MTEKAVSTTPLSPDELNRLDRAHLWHPYTSFTNPPPVTPVMGGEGVYLHLADGRKLVDGISSWWSAVHGYNHPVLNKAVTDQLHKMAHVMFAGITHEPAVKLAATLARITPEGLNKVFFSDSGSVAVEVAMKMAVQYWHSQGQSQRTLFLSFKRGYHGDTFGAMSVCDPHSGMHHMFHHMLSHQLFADAPATGFEEPFQESHIAKFSQMIQQHRQKIAAVILEPIMQGAGGMHFYSPQFLQRVKQLCDQHQILLIADEIATGFGRTGKLFACEHASISPDIMCIGKALSGGYITLAATLCNDRVSSGICQGDYSALMHGPTYMANPLACAVANASIDLLMKSDWQQKVKRISEQLHHELMPCREFSYVKDVRVLGAIGVVELEKPFNTHELTQAFVAQGVWVRPMGQVIYLMPPFIINPEELSKLTAAVAKVIANMAK